MGVNTGGVGSGSTVSIVTMLFSSTVTYTIIPHLNFKVTLTSLTIKVGSGSSVSKIPYILSLRQKSHIAIPHQYL